MDCTQKKNKPSNKGTADFDYAKISGKTCKNLLCTPLGHSYSQMLHKHAITTSILYILAILSDISHFILEPRVTENQTDLTNLIYVLELKYFFV